MAINLTNVRLFLWEESNAIPYDEGLFFFNFITSNKQPLCLATTFKLQNLKNGTIPNHLFSDILARQGIVRTQDHSLLARQVSDFFLSNFRFRGFDFHCLRSRLVFVLDIVSDSPPPQLQSPCLRRSQISTSNFGLPQLPHKLFQQQDAQNHNDARSTSFYGPFKLPHEHMAPKQVTDCLDANEVDHEELNHVLASLNNLFDLKESKSSCSSSVHETLHKVRPTIEIMQRTGHGKDRRVHEDDEDMCSICLDKISVESELRKMVRCKHVFHDRCIFKWLPRKQSCPYCRTSSTIDVYL